jgi:ornithine cyclodeaminase/alanine dehydrogenase-like protein (mu-crystallin family)
MTLLLSRSTIEAALEIDEVLDMLAHGFRDATDEPRPQRIRTDLPGPGTATCLIPGLLPEVPAYTVKVNAKFPASFPALRGVVCLHDLNTGELLALADSASVTAWRTGLSAALGTHALADPTARTLGFVGAGTQARMVAAGLRTLRSFDQTVATDLDRRRAADLADVVVDDARAVAVRCDIVILATWSRVPLLHAEDIATVTHLTTLGGDEPGKIELAADVLRRSRVVVDDVELVAASGALGNAGLDATAAHGTLADVLRGVHATRDESNRTTVYAPIGLPWQDLAIVWPVYLRARHAGVPEIDLLA